jgi:hypothetical protein
MCPWISYLWTQLVWPPLMHLNFSMEFHKSYETKGGVRKCASAICTQTKLQTLDVCETNRTDEPVSLYTSEVCLKNNNSKVL